ncbi:multidrug transporter [Streptomyces sp. TRM43335]|uniref:Multidrug transporter n=1 Tax=Streptomyces taklimakanensis TaxID=2569853 RepID=A0A6G2B8G1_9ACTN|nr:phosphodiester glycosidase family protein [Streptomyces taklimakanensis]MTE18551.1 multidrug transporter [Streptomyces taklimakanensis]
MSVSRGSHSRRVRQWVVVCAAAVSALVLGPALPSATAVPSTAVPPSLSLRAADTRTAAVADEGLEISRTTRPVAPGTTLTSFDRLEPDKWLRADALSVDLDGGAGVDYLSSGGVSDRATVSELAAEHDPGPGRRTVAAFNADFFDINRTGAPLGPGIDDGEVTHSPAPGVTEAVGFGPDGAGRILDLYFEGTLALPDGPVPLAAYNAANVPAGGIGAYNARWGKADRALTVGGAEEVTEVTVSSGRVVSVSDTPGSGPIPEGTTVLIGRDAGAGALAGLSPGTAVSWEYELRTEDGGTAPDTAVGGRGVLVVDGEPQNWDGRPNNTAAPRTAVGFSRDGTTLHVLTVDGRQAASGGVTLTELAEMMDDLGAHNALNLDGGGSSTLVVREPGSDTLRVENSPSDGSEREVPNGLAVTAPDGSGRLEGFRVETAADPARTPSADNVPGGHPERVFPGLTRALTAAGHDETYGPADGAARWHSTRPEIGRVDGDGVFHARRTGRTEAVARLGRARGSLELTVLGPLERIEPTRERVGLAGPDDTGSFGFVGFDADGHSAPVDPSDVTLDYDRSLFRVAPDPTGGDFTVSAADGTGSVSGLVRATVRGAGGGEDATAVLAVTVGLRDLPVADFEDAGEWTFSAARASGSLAAVPEGRDGAGLRMTYDFTRSTATRAAYANPPRQIEVPGRPQSFALWLKGDGHGAWPSLHLTDAAGTAQVLRGPYVTWTGWRQVVFEVPEGVAHPLRVRRFYLAETRAAEQYDGAVVLDGLTARVPPDVALPDTVEHRDPLISTAADTAGRDWRFAVVSDAQFVARDPDSPLVRQARRTLREVRAARPDFVVVNGDWVDEGSPQDLAFARRMLEEELGDEVPWYYVPGNHEVMGGSIDAFRAEFGETHRVFDHKGTRFITLDTSSLTLRGGGWEQIRLVRERLDAAARDRGIGSVVVLAHVPPRDPTPQQGSRLTDRYEADLLEDWLGDFRHRTGKGAAFIGSHVGVFHASRVAGVPYLVNGNAGKAPAAPADEGGFSGWSLVGVDREARDAGRDWISVQTRAHVDGLSLDAPETVEAGGAPGEVSAAVVQGSGASARTVPVGRPLSADWSGSRGLCTGEAKRARGHCVAVLDSEAGTLTGLRPGTVEVAVTVSGERRRARVTVVR